MSAFAPSSARAAQAPRGLPRLLTGLDASGLPMRLGEHERIHGRVSAPAPAELIELVARSGLRGRGGADFPTAQKLRAVAGRRRRPVVVVNGSETEPGSHKDRLLLSRLPHLVLDGAGLAAGAVGASAVIVKVSETAVGSLRALEEAIAERPAGGVSFTVAAGQAGYVTGEETAVLSFLEGGASVPRSVPPRPYERGLRGRPTLIQNPETLAQIALVARYGSRWYRELGTEADPGSALVSIAGAVGAPGVYELAFGTSMRDLLAAAGGVTEPLQALLVGGYFGSWIDGSRAVELRLAREDLRSAGSALGAGVLFALGDSACAMHESARVVDYLASQSAGQCGPCVHGLAAIAGSFSAIADGLTHGSESARLLRWCDEVSHRGACHHPDGVIRFVRSALTEFGEAAGHSRARCPARPAGLPLPTARVR